MLKSRKKLIHLHFSWKPLQNFIIFSLLIYIYKPFLNHSIKWQHTWIPDIERPVHNRNVMDLMLSDMQLSHQEAFIGLES